jgi:hypothetical protein
VFQVGSEDTFNGELVQEPDGSTNVIPVRVCDHDPVDTFYFIPVQVIDELIDGLRRSGVDDGNLTVGRFQDVRVPVTDR